MSTPREFLVKFIPESVQEIARTGNAVMRAIGFVLEPATEVGEDVVRITHKRLLPSTSGSYIDTDEYIDIGEAADEVGKSASTLRKWAQKKKIRAKKDSSGKWWLLRDSLRKYVASDTKG